MTTLGAGPAGRGRAASLRPIWQSFDIVLLATAAFLVVYGVVMIRSTTHGSPTLSDLAVKQVRFGVVSAILVFVVAAIDYRYWRGLSQVLYLGTLVTLLGLFLFGLDLFGSRRWFDFFGIFLIQPAELAKFGSVLWISNFFATQQEKLGQFRLVLISLVLAAIPAALILIQPDLSSAIMIMVAWMGIAWAAGVRWRHLVFLGAGALASLPVLWTVMADYQRARISNFLNPASDPGAQYNVNQALISIGSGGWFGAGYNQASQVQSRFLKVRHTDFIFSATAAEFGLVGVLAMLLALTVVVLRILRVARVAGEPFGAYVCYGIATVIFVQTLLNVGMNLNLSPVTGLPLPLVSYGGSALLANGVGLGLVQSVALHHR